MEYLIFKSFLPEIFLSLCILVHLLINGVFVINYNFPILIQESFNQTFFILSSVFILLCNNHIEGYFLNYFFINESNGNFLKIFFLFNAIVLLFIIIQSFCFSKLNFFEYFIIYLIVIFASLLLFNSMDMLSAYLILEMQTLAFFVLAAFKRNSVFSIEAGIKYFIIGAITSAIFLFGCSLFYGYFGTLNFFELNIVVPFLIKEISTQGYIFVIIACIFILVTFFIKFAFVPFHFWAPDVYEGSPLPSTIIFSIVPKLALLHFFIKWVYLILSTFSELSFIMSIVGLLSIVVGLSFALGQTRLKRFIIYSSIAQGGFLSIGLSNISLVSVVSTYFFLLNYLVTVTVIWSIIAVLYFYKNDLIYFYETKLAPLYLSDFSMFFSKNNSWAILILFAFFSLLGIPPFTGFFAKAFILYGLIICNIKYLSIILILVNSISAFYYLRFLKIIFFDTKNTQTYFYNLHTFYFNSNVFYVSIFSAVFSFFLIVIFFEPSLSLLACYKACVSTFSGF